MSRLDDLYNGLVNSSNQENKAVRSDFKPLILDDEEDIQTQNVGANVADQKSVPQYVEVDKPKFVQPEQRSYYVAGNVANNEIHTTAQRPNEIEYEADVVDDEKKKDNYFGLSKLKTNKVDIVKNALKYVASRANPIKAITDDIGKLTGKSGNDVALEGVRGFAGSTVDFASTLKRFFYQNYMYYKGYKDEQLDKIANLGNVVTGGDSFSDEIKQKYTDFYNRVDEQTKELIDKTERFLQEYGIAKTDKDGFIYDLVGGASSLMYAIGLTAITKSPAAAAEFFGMYQYQGLYEEGIEKGFSPIKARTIGVIGGAAEGALEMVGLHMLIETLVARKSFMKLLKAAATEFIQEASQQGAEELIAKLSGMREEGLLTILQNVGYAGLIGALIGGGSAKISDIFHKQISDSATRELINRGVNSDYAKQMVNNMLDYSISPQVLNEMINILKDEQSPVTYKNADPRETYKETGEAIKKVLDPQQKREIEIEFIDEKQKLTQKLADALVNSGKVQNNDEAYRQAEAAVSFYDELAREAYNQENIRPSEYYKRFNVNAQSGNIEIDERNVDEDNPFVDVSFDPVDFDDQARAEYEAAMDAEQAYYDSVQKENKTTLKKEARILGDMGIDAIRRPTADGYGKERWSEYNDLSPRIKKYFFTDTETAMTWDEAEDLLAKSGNSIKDLFEYLAKVDERAVTLNQPGVFGKVLQKEKEAIKQQAIADGTFMKAPNGKDSNLPEQLWLIVRTKAFKNWFGDWLNDPQNASKVVDENGEPLVVYHGTIKGGFSIFKNSKKGIWFSNEDVAGDYGFAMDEETGEPIRIKQGDDPYTQGVYPVFLNIKKPLVVDYQGKGALSTEKSPSEIFEEQVANGKQYDGFIVKNVKDYGEPMGATTEYYKQPHDTYAVKISEQVKSINNRGSFDRRNPDIYYQRSVTVPTDKADKNNYIFKITAKDLVEVRTIGEINEKLDKIFGPYADYDPFDDNSDPKDVMNILADNYRADLEYAARERDYNETKQILDSIKKDIVEISKRKDYNNINEEKENDLSDTSRSGVLRTEKSAERNLYSNSAKTDLQVKNLSIEQLKNINDDIVLHLFTRNKVYNDIEQNINTSELDEETIKFLKDNGIDIDKNGVFVDIKQVSGDKENWRGVARDVDFLIKRAEDLTDRGWVKSAKYYKQQAKKLQELLNKLDNVQEKLRTYIAKNSPKQSPQQQSQLQLQADMQQPMLDIFFQAAYTGSPVDHNGFSVDYIGTGEGALAHGWGLYSAQLRQIAEKYRIRLIKKRIEGFFAKNGYEFGAIDEIEQIIDNGDFKEDKEIVDFLKALKEDDWLGFSNIYEAIDAALNYKNNKEFDLSDKLKKAVDTVGQVFEIDIPENDVLLDENKPLLIQSEKVKKGLIELFKSEEFKNEFFGYVQNYTDNEYQKLLKKYFDAVVTNFNTEKQREVFKELRKFREEKYYLFEDDDIDFEEMIKTIGGITRDDKPINGYEIYGLLKQILGTKKQASLLLNKYGVKGITYDGQQDGRAFVIFDDKAIKILEKYYQELKQSEPRGATTIYDRQYFIDLFSGSDKSTLLHETGHVFLSEILYFARSKNASKKVLEIKKKLDEWLGEPEDNGRYSTRQQELFATSAETFFREGKAPTAKLKTVFERFKKWLSDIYDRIKDDLPNISNDVRELFDTILSRSYNVPDSNIYAGKEAAIKEVIKNIQEGRASEVDGITIDDVYNLLNMAYTRKPSRPSKNLKQLLNDKNIYDFNELNKAGADTVLQILKDGGYVKADATAEQAVELAKKALDGNPVYRLADQWRVAGDIDFARNLRVLEKVIEFSQIDSTLEKILSLQQEGYRNVEQSDVDKVQDEYKRLMSADVKEAKRIVEDIINRLHKKRFIDRAAQKQMIVDLNFSSTVEEIRESVLNVIEDLQDEIKLVKEQLRNPRKPVVRKDKTIPPGKNATEEEKNTYKKYMKKQINRLLKQALPRKQNQQKFSKFDKPTQDFFTDLEKYNKMTIEQAQEELYKRATGIIDDEGVGLNNYEKMKNMFLSYKANKINQNTTEFYKQLYDNLMQINVFGRNAKEIEETLKKEQIQKDINSLVVNIEDNKSKNKGGEFAKKWYVLGLGNWWSTINAIAGKKQADKDSMERNDIVNFVENAEISDDLKTKCAAAWGFKNTTDLDMTVNRYLNEEYTYEELDPSSNTRNAVKLNKLQLMHCYIDMKNTVGRERIVRAYGNDQIMDMMSKLTIQDQKCCDVLQKTIADLYPDINRVYLKMYGLDMPQAENYFPFTPERIQGNMDLLKDNIGAASLPGFFKARSQSNLPLMNFGNPFKIALDHIAKVVHFINFQEKLADLNKVYKATVVKRHITNAYGESVYRYILQLLDNEKFQNVTKTIDAASSIGDYLTNNYVLTKIAVKPSIMIKQLLSCINYAEDMSCTKWFEGFLKGVASPKKVIDFMMKNSKYCKQRFAKGGQTEALLKAMEGSNATIAKVKTFKGALSWMTRVGDIGAIMFGGYPYVMDQMSKGVPLQTAIENFERATIRSQQASMPSTLSNWQYRGMDNWLVRALFAFANTANQYSRKAGDTIYMYMHGDIGKKQLAKNLIIYGALNPLLYTSFTSLSILTGLISGNWDDLKDDIIMSLMQCSNLLSLPIIGQGYNYAVQRLILDTRVPQKEIPLLAEIMDIIDTLKKEDIEMKDWLTIIDDTASLVFGVPIKTLYNTFVGSTKDLLDGEYGKFAVKLYGATESRANKIFD